MYNERKAAQVAAYFAAQQGGTISNLKLMKLMYLTERLSLHEFGESMLNDNLVSMKFGPVLSRTKDCMDGLGDRNLEDGWEGWISDIANHKVTLAKQDFSNELLDEVSPSEIDLMASVWAEHGGKDQFALAEYTHAHCAEWRNPGSSTLPISYEDVLRAGGLVDESASALAREIKDRQQATKLLHQL